MGEFPNIETLLKLMMQKPDAGFMIQGSRLNTRNVVYVLNLGQTTNSITYCSISTPPSMTFNELPEEVVKQTQLQPLEDIQTVHGQERF